MVQTPNCRKRILLADDDEDDCILFEDALKEICPERSNLTTTNDGFRLMQLLKSPAPHSPDIIFLDLNMPVKNGFQCLSEIRKNKDLKSIPVVIFSTTAQKEAIDKVYEGGASLYIRKPGSFSKLKHLIEKVLSMDWKGGLQTPKESFVL
jgi:CheY-like chemotaxis protein